MSRLFASWRALRWLAFLFSFAIDFYIFHISDPFTPLSFMTSGIAAVILFVFFFEVARSMKGSRRIRQALDNERVSYRVGQHVLALFRKIRADGLAYDAIWFPVWIAIFATAGIAWIMWQHLTGAPSEFGYAWTTLAQYACGFYLPLIVSIPFVLEHVSEWTSHQYVLAVDTKTLDPRLLIHHGVFDYDLETVSIERTVTTRVHQAWWQAMVGIGDVELRETAGGEGETLHDVWKPRLLERKIRTAIKASKRRAPAD